MQYRFFMYHFGPVYVKCKKVNRKGQIFYRDTMGNEMPAYKTAKNLSGDDRDAFVRAYNASLSTRTEAHNIIHPEDELCIPGNMTYEQILDEIKKLEG